MEGHFSVDSSHLKSVAWEDGVLEVAFRSGHVYRYEGVPEHVYIELVNASSPGKTFSRLVKGHFEAERVT